MSENNVIRIIRKKEFTLVKEKYGTWILPKKIKDKDIIKHLFPMILIATLKIKK